MFMKRFYQRTVSLILALLLVPHVLFFDCSASAETADGVIAEITFTNDLDAVGARAFSGDSATPLKVFEHGLEAWKLDPTTLKNNRYIYVDIADSIMYNMTDGRNIEVEVEYFDAENTSLTLEYPKFDWVNLTTERPYPSKQLNVTNETELAILDFTNTQNWKTHTWMLERAWLNNSLNGADFRIGIYSDRMNYSKNAVLIRSIKVRDTGTNSRMDINVKSDNFGHIFYTGDTMRFNVEFDNSTSNYAAGKAGTIPAEITYTLLDSLKRECGKIVRNAEIKPYQIFMDSVEFTPTRYDLYTLKVEIRSEKTKLYSFVERDCSYVKSSKGKIINKHAGISVPSMMNEFSGAEKDFPNELAKIVRYAGYDIARINFSTQQTAMSAYDHFESNETATHITFGDAVQALKDNGIKVMMYCTAFTRSNQKHINALWYEDIGYVLPYTDEGRQRLLKNELAVLSEQFGNIDIWEIMNETNAAPTVTPTQDKYVSETLAVEKMVLPIIREMFPNVIVGTTQYAHASVKDWFTDYFEKGAVMGQDFISIHPYMANGDPVTNVMMYKHNSTAAAVNGAELYELCQKYGFDGEIWATEYGSSPGWHSWPRDNVMQAAINVTTYLNMTSAEEVVDKMILFRLDDKYPEKERSSMEYTYGIIKPLHDYEPNRAAAKPAYLAEANKNLLMYDAKYVDNIKLNENTIGYRYRKTESKTDMFTMFTNKDLDIMSVDLGTDSVTLMDLYGNETILTSDSGVYTFSVTAEPFYCTGSFNKFEIVDSSEAYPLQTTVTAVFGEEAEFDIINNTDEALEVSLTVDKNSEVEIPEVVTAEPGISTVQLKCGLTGLKAVERIGVSIKGSDGIKFNGYVCLDYDNSRIQLSTELKNNNGKWVIYSTVTNITDNVNMSGQIRFVYPYDLAQQIEPIDVVSEAGTVKIYEMELPEGMETGDSLNVTTGFFNEAGIAQTYNTEQLDFVYAPKAKNIKIDGDLSEWESGWMYLDKAEQFESTYSIENLYSGVNDLWARVALQWDEDYLYFAAESHDDVFYYTGYTPETMWNLDDFQIAFLYDPNGNIVEKNTFEEISFSYLDGQPTVYRNRTVQQDLENPSEVEGCEIVITKDGNVMNYEIKLPWTSLLPEDWGKPAAGTSLKFGLLLNENDGLGRKGYYKLGDGIASTKDSTKFLSIYFAN